MPNEKTLELIATTMDSLSGPHLSGTPLVYRVKGMPHGQIAEIGNLTGQFWQFRFGPEPTLGKWTGTYETADGALQHLRHALGEQS